MCCTNHIDRTKRDKENILSLHKLQREYHFNKEADQFVSQFSPTFISINNGEISSPSRQESEKKFNNYFQQVDFKKWDDIREPEIRFSDDHTMAYVVVSKEVAVEFSNASKEMVRETTEFAWVAIYKKINGNWKIDCVISTNKPPVSQ